MNCVYSYPQPVGNCVDNYDCAHVFVDDCTQHHSRNHAH